MITDCNFTWPNACISIVQSEITLSPFVFGWNNFSHHNGPVKKNKTKNKTSFKWKLHCFQKRQIISFPATLHLYLCTCFTNLVQFHRHVWDLCHSLFTDRWNYMLLKYAVYVMCHCHTFIFFLNLVIILLPSEQNYSVFCKLFKKEKKKNPYCSDWGWIKVNLCFYYRLWKWTGTYYMELAHPRTKFQI